MTTRAEHGLPEKPSGGRRSGDGATVRDQFAMAALTGIMARGVTPEEAKDVAPAAYAYADSMMRERDK